MTLIALAAIIATPISLHIVLKAVKDMQVLPSGAPVRLQELQMTQQHDHEVRSSAQQHEMLMQREAFRMEQEQAQRQELTEEQVLDG